MPARPILRPLAGLVLFGLLSGCPFGDDGDPSFFTPAEKALLAGLSPLPPVPLDPTNAFADTPPAAALGKLYFFDPRFSGLMTDTANDGPGGNGPSGTTAHVSCSQCHNPATGFADHRSQPGNTSLGSTFTGRNAPTIYNAAYNDFQFWDGRKDSQWSQALGPTESPAEHNGNRVQFAMVIKIHYTNGPADHDEVFGPLDGSVLPPFVANLGNPAAFNPPFPVPPAPPHFEGQGRPGDSSSTDPIYVANPGNFATYDLSLNAAQKDQIDRIFADFGKSMAAYERLVVSRNSRFDQWAAGDKGALSHAEARGLKVFLGKGRCAICHGGANFTDNRFHNIGTMQAGPHVPGTDTGRFDGVPKVLGDPFNGVGAFSDDVVAGNIKLSGLVQTPSQLGQFKTSTLRSIGETAPYLHHGSKATLREVIEFYNQGGDPSGFVGTNELVPLGLTETEIDDLVKFLLALDGEELPASVTSVPVLPP